MYFLQGSLLSMMKEIYILLRLSQIILKTDDLVFHSFSIIWYKKQCLTTICRKCTYKWIKQHKVLHKQFGETGTFRSSILDSIQKETNRKRIQKILSTVNDNRNLHHTGFLKCENVTVEATWNHKFVLLESMFSWCLVFFVWGTHCFSSSEIQVDVNIFFYNCFTITLNHYLFSQQLHVFVNPFSASTTFFGQLG